MSISYYLIMSALLLSTFFFGTIFTLVFLHIPVTRTYMIPFGIYVVLSFACQFFIGFHYSFELALKYYPILVHIPLFVLCVLIYRRSGLQVLSCILICYFLCSPRYVLAYVISFCFPHLPYALDSGRVIATFIVSLFTWYFLVPSFQNVLKRGKKELFFFLLPFTLFYLLSYGLFQYSSFLIKQPLFLSMLCICFFFLLVIHYIQLYFISYDEAHALELKNQILTFSTSSIRSQEHFIQDSYQEMRILRHDIRHLSALIQEAASTGNENQILHTLSTISALLDTKTPKTYCTNQPINLILFAYLRPFYHDNIPVTVNVNLPEILSFSDLDVATLLSASLEQVYDSSKDIKDAFLNLTLSGMKDKLFLKIENRCLRSIPFENGIPIGISPEEALAITNIQAIVDKYHGLLSFSQKDKTFTMKLILHQP